MILPFFIFCSSSFRCPLSVQLFYQFLCTSCSVFSHRLHFSNSFHFLVATVHSFRPFLLRPFKSSTTQRGSRLQHGYCIGVSRRSAQATADNGLAQGPYMAARAGVEPTTLRLKVIVSTTAPPRPTSMPMVELRRGCFAPNQSINQYSF